MTTINGQHISGDALALQMAATARPNKGNISLIIQNRIESATAITVKLTINGTRQ